MRALPALLALLAATVARAEELVGPPAPAARLEAAERTFDAGKVDRGSKVTHTFVLKNVGGAALSVDAKPG